MTRKSRMFIMAAFAMLIALAHAQAPDTIWTRRYNGPSNGIDEAKGCALDSSGHLFVTGYSTIGGYADYLTIKYNAATGDTLWTRRYNGPDNGQDWANACALDGSGHLFVTGYAVIGGHPNFLTIRYNAATGDTLWTRSYHGPANSDDRANGCAVDGAGNLYVAGYSWNGTNDDFVTIKYNGATGDTAWVRRYNGPANSDDDAYGCAVDGAGGLYVTGASWTGASWDFLTIKYNAATGDTAWTRRYAGPAGANDFARACIPDGLGHLYVAGGSSNGLNYDYLAVKYDAASGDTLWTSRYNGPANNDDVAISCGVFRGGHVFVAGFSSNGSNNDWLTMGLDAATGDTLWTCRYNSPANADDDAFGCACDSAGNLYVTGFSSTGGANEDYLTIKYNTSAGVAGRPEAAIAGPGALLCRATPNPAGGRISFSYNLPNPANARLAVYNLAGQLVKAFDLGLQGAGPHSVAWRSSNVAAGIYCYRLSAGGRRAVGKLVIVK